MSATTSSGVSRPFSELISVEQHSWTPQNPVDMLTSSLEETVQHIQEGVRVIGGNDEHADACIGRHAVSTLCIIGRKENPARGT